MKKAYVKPELNVSMNGTLEGVYACYGYEPRQNPQPSSKNNNGNSGCYNPCNPQPSRCNYWEWFWWWIFG